MYYQQEIETMPVEKLRALQLERMRDSLRNAYENVDFFKQRSFAEAGVTPADLTSLEDLVKFPFVVRQDMRDAYPFGLFARSQRDVTHSRFLGTTARRPSSAQRKTISRTGATASLAVSTWSAARRIRPFRWRTALVFSPVALAPPKRRAVGCTVIPRPRAIRSVKFR